MLVSVFSNIAKLTSTHRYSKARHRGPNYGSSSVFAVCFFDTHRFQLSSSTFVDSGCRQPIRGLLGSFLCQPWGYRISPFLQMYLSPYYAAEVQAAVVQITDPTLAATAASVADIPTFIWLDSVSKVPSLDTYMADAAQQSGCTIVPIGKTDVFVFHQQYSNILCIS